MDFMGIGPLELLVILVIALLVLGPHRFQGAARGLGKFFREMKKMGSELTEMLEEEEEPPPRKSK